MVGAKFPLMCSRLVIPSELTFFWITGIFNRYYNAWIESSEEQSSSSNSTDTDSASKNKPVEDSLLELNKIEAPSLRADRQSGDESWWKEGEEDGSESSSSGSQDSVRSPQKSHSTSFFSSKSKSSERIVFGPAKIDESVSQFGDLMDTEVRYFSLDCEHDSLISVGGKWASKIHWRVAFADWLIGSTISGKWWAPLAAALSRQRSRVVRGPHLKSGDPVLKSRSDHQRDLLR